MIKVRRGTFETNSSSVHAIAIQKNNNFTSIDVEHGMYDYSEAKCSSYAETLSIYPDAFYDEFCLYTSPRSKLSYIYTASILLDKENDFCKTLKWLKEDSIKYKFYKYKKTEKNPFNVYIDHYDYVDSKCKCVLEEFLNFVFSNKDIFYNFVFNDRSYIWTGSDGSPVIPHVYVDEDEYISFIKEN